MVAQDSVQQSQARVGDIVWTMVHSKVKKDKQVDIWGPSTVVHTVDEEGDSLFYISPT